MLAMSPVTKIFYFSSFKACKGSCMGKLICDLLKVLNDKKSKLIKHNVRRNQQLRFKRTDFLGKWQKFTLSDKVTKGEKYILVNEQKKTN